MNSQRITYRLTALILRAALVAALAGAVWVVYKRLPDNGPSSSLTSSGQTIIQIILQPPPDMGNAPRDIPVEISPVDIVAVRHEFFVEPRAGQRFDDFLRQRMNGRALINARLDKVSAVTKDDVQRVANKYLSETNRTIIITMPKAKAPGRTAATGQ